MNTNFKNYLLENTQLAENATAKKKTEYIWSPEILGGPDFVIHRSTTANPNKKTSAVFLLSLETPQFYIKEGNTTKAMTEENLKNFFRCLKSPLYLGVNNQTPNWIERFPSENSEIATLWAAINFNVVKRLCVLGLVMYEPKPTAGRTSSWLNTALYSINHFNEEKMSKIIKYGSLIGKHLPEELKNGFKKNLWNTLISSYGYYSQMSEDMKKTKGIAEFAIWSNMQELENFISYYGDSGLISLIETYANSPCKGFKWYGLSTLLSQTTFQHKNFINHLFHSSYEQGYGDTLHNFMIEWRECLELQKQLYGDIQEKYPQYLCSENVKLRFKAAVLKDLKNKQLFEERKQYFKAHEWENDTMQILAPTCVQDIIDEGQKQANCVGSYVQTVINGKCEIYFLRKKDSLTKSYVTVEVRDGKIVQAKAKYNKEPDPEAWAALREFEKAYNKINF